MRSRRALVASALLAVATTSLLAACTPGDDTDLFATPTPEETPEEPGVHCQIVWTSLHTGTAGLLDVFVLDAPEDTWNAVAGTGSFDAFTAWYQPAILFDADDHVMAASLDERGAVVASSHSFAYTLSLNATHDGGSLSISDASPNTLYAIDEDGIATTAVFGTNDVLTFNGVWSSRDPEDLLTLAPGQVRLLVGTAATIVTLGAHGNYALCYDTEPASTHAATSAGLARLPRR